MSRLGRDLLRVRVLGFVGMAVVLSCLDVTAGQEPPQPPESRRSSRPGVPNIILIVVDSLRADLVGSYGQAGNPTPVIDRIANEGMVFEHCAAAAPWTLPSMASMFVSVYPDVHQMTGFVVTPGSERISVDSRLRTDFLTLAERLRESGYQTAGFSANPFIRAELGFAQGFDYFDSRFASNSTDGSVVSGLALSWVRRHRDPKRPLFLYLHYMDVHGPYDAHARFMTPLVGAVERSVGISGAMTDVVGVLPSYLDRPVSNDVDGSRHRRLRGFRDYWVARYKAGVMQVDANLQRLISGLESIDVWDQSLVILTADHGEALGEHGMWDHGFSLFETDLHVPLIVRWPGHVAGGLRNSTRVSLVDVLPTVLNAVGIGTGNGIDGEVVSFAEAETEVRERPRLAFGVKNDSRTIALFEGNMKLVVSRSGPTGEGGRPERTESALFALDEDPNERRNLAKDRPRLVGEMLTQLRSFYSARVATSFMGPAQPTEIEEGIRDSLESLGYVAPREDQGPPQ